MAASLTRREFLQATSLTTVSLLTTPAFIHKSAGPNIRVGCCASNFHGFKAGADPLPAIDLIGQMGFDGIELIALSPDDLSTLWSGEKFDAIRRALDAGKLTVSRFGVFGPFFTDILSGNTAKRDASLENFAKACTVARQLGAPQMGYIGWPVPGTNPNTYTLKRDAKPGEKLTMPLPVNLNWPDLWGRAVAGTKACLERAKAHNLTICVEPHYHGIPQTAEQFLLLRNEVNDPAFGYLLDSCWTTIQCAYPPLLANMMGPHITNVQFRDTDATNRNAFVSFGAGAVDFIELLKALKAVNYRGFISLEEVFMKPDVAAADAKNFLAFMRAELAKP